MRRENEGKLTRKVGVFPRGECFDTENGKEKEILFRPLFRFNSSPQHTFTFKICIFVLRKINLQFSLHTYFLHLERVRPDSPPTLLPLRETHSAQSSEKEREKKKQKTHAKKSRWASHQMLLRHHEFGAPPPYVHAHKKSPILPGEYEALYAELTDEAEEGKRKPMLQDVFLSFHV
jgi:hypothetical protein